jgi:hypothetical protein
MLQPGPGVGIAGEHGLVQHFGERRGRIEPAQQRREKAPRPQQLRPVGGIALQVPAGGKQRHDHRQSVLLYSCDGVGERARLCQQVWLHW